MCTILEAQASHLALVLIKGKLQLAQLLLLVPQLVAQALLLAPQVGHLPQQARILRHLVPPGLQAVKQVPPAAMLAVQAARMAQTAWEFTPSWHQSAPYDRHLQLR